MFADIALCPFEAVKVRVQTQPGYGFGLVDGLPKYVAEDGWAGLYKGIVPLWGRQIPYTGERRLFYLTYADAMLDKADRKVPGPYSNRQFDAFGVGD